MLGKVLKVTGLVALGALEVILSVSDEDDSDSDDGVDADLVTWQEDDAKLEKKKGDHVTNEDLHAIAEREEIDVESDDNKDDLQRKIMAGRADKAESNAD